MSTPTRRTELSRFPVVDALEERCLLSAFAQSQAYYIQQAWHDYHRYVSELQQVELASHATPAESLALSDAARTLSADAAADGTPAVQARADAATAQLDQAPLYGWLGETGWATVRSRLSDSLRTLRVPESAIDQAIAAMQAVAQSAGVTNSEFDDLTAKEASYERAREQVWNSTSHFPDPAIYYTKHLRGFFRGAAVARTQAQTTLDADLETIEREANDSSAGTDVLRRDVQLLQHVGATVTSQAFAAFSDAFVTAFQNGAPDAAAQQALATRFRSILGTNAVPSALNAADRLVADTPAFFQAAAASSVNIRTIANDVVVLVANGGGAAPNAYKIQIPRGSRGESLSLSPSASAVSGPGAPL